MAPIPGLASGRIVVALDELAADRAMAALIAPCEVMIQEGISALAVTPTGLGQLPELIDIFGERAGFGLRGRPNPAQVEAAAAAGATFVVLTLPDAAAEEAARANGLALVVSAMTPAEIQGVADRGADAVLVAPADALGVEFPRHLAEELPGLPLLVGGRVDLYLAERWLDHGAAGLVLGGVLTGNAFDGGSLAGLRVRCADYRAVVRRCAQSPSGLTT